MATALKIVTRLMWGLFQVGLVLMSVMWIRHEYNVAKASDTRSWTPEDRATAREMYGAVSRIGQKRDVVDAGATFISGGEPRFICEHNAKELSETRNLAEEAA